MKKNLFNGSSLVIWFLPLVLLIAILAVIYILFFLKDNEVDSLNTQFIIPEIKQHAVFDPKGIFVSSPVLKAMIEAHSIAFTESDWTLFYEKISRYYNVEKLIFDDSLQNFLLYDGKSVYLHKIHGKEDPLLLPFSNNSILTLLPDGIVISLIESDSGGTQALFKGDFKKVNQALLNSTNLDTSENKKSSKSDFTKLMEKNLLSEPVLFGRPIKKGQISAYASNSQKISIIDFEYGGSLYIVDNNKKNRKVFEKNNCLSSKWISDEYLAAECRNDQSYLPELFLINSDDFTYNIIDSVGGLRFFTPINEEKAVIFDGETLEEYQFKSGEKRALISINQKISMPLERIAYFSGKIFLLAGNTVYSIDYPFL